MLYVLPYMIAADITNTLQVRKRESLENETEDLRRALDAARESAQRTRSDIENETATLTRRLEAMREELHREKKKAETETNGLRQALAAEKEETSVLREQVALLKENVERLSSSLATAKSESKRDLSPKSFEQPERESEERSPLRSPIGLGGLQRESDNVNVRNCNYGTSYL